MPQTNNPPLLKAIWPLLFFFVLLVYGLFLHPVVFKEPMLPLEVLILMAISFSSIYLMIVGYSWETIQAHIVNKVAESVPVLLILFCIGVLIGSWIISGTIPMLIYYGISAVDPGWIYLFSFIICIVFSLLTGTSWGSAGTIGIVMLGISEIYGANPAITVGAIVGGSFFGDKMSPLSDTTNIASLATGVDLMDHIRSMTYTTGPSAILAALVYACLSPALNKTGTLPDIQLEQIDQTLAALDDMFEFHILLLLPLLLVIWGSIRKKPVILTLLAASWLAMILALIFQDFSFSEVFHAFNKGFSTEMGLNQGAENNTLDILNRGGLYNLIEGITISILIFAFIGTLKVMNTIDITISRLMNSLSTAPKAIASALTTTLFTNLMSSNQYATSFIIGEAFRKKFDRLKIPRKVLSRSIEDAGTMMENLVPWTPSGIFMATTLGVSAFEYAPYQFLSIFNILIAYFFAFTGIACFMPKQKMIDEK